MLTRGIPPDFRGGVHLLCILNWSMVTRKGSTRYSNYIEDYCQPCAGGLSVVNAISTRLRDPIKSDLRTRWRIKAVCMYLIRHRVLSPELIGSCNRVRTDGLHCREPAGTGPPVVLNVVPETGAAFFAGHHGPNNVRLHFLFLLPSIR